MYEYDNDNKHSAVPCAAYINMFPSISHQFIFAYDRCYLFVSKVVFSFLHRVMSKPLPVQRLLHIMAIKANVKAVLQALFPFKHALNSL